jgi:hypothetical protein
VGNKIPIYTPISILSGERKTGTRKEGRKRAVAGMVITMSLVWVRCPERTRKMENEKCGDDDLKTLLDGTRKPSGIIPRQIAVGVLGVGHKNQSAR